MAKQSAKTADPYVIKRYANRKLYDTITRQFTTLDQLGALIEKGTRLVVTEHDTGEDRTSDVLAQVLGRRIKAGSGDSDALGELLRTPASAATSLTGGLLGSLIDVRPSPPKAAKPASKAKPKSESQAKRKSDKEKAAKKAAKAAAAEREELIELRKQVSELTSVVHLLLKDRNGDDA